MIIRLTARTPLLMLMLLVAACHQPRFELSESSIREIESAVGDIVTPGDRVTWRALDTSDARDSEIIVEGTFWSTLAKHDTRLAHRIVARIDESSGRLTGMMIDGFTYERHPSTGKWWDGEEISDPEERFVHLSAERKNELWWEIDSRVQRDRDRGNSSTTITWPLHDLIQLTNRFDVTPLEISEFFEYGIDAEWRTEASPVSQGR